MIEGGVDEDGSGRGFLLGGSLDDGKGVKGGSKDGRGGAGAGWIRGGDGDRMDGSKGNF